MKPQDALSATYERSLVERRYAIANHAITEHTIVGAWNLPSRELYIVVLDNAVESERPYVGDCLVIGDYEALILSVERFPLLSPRYVPDGKRGVGVKAVCREAFKIGSVVRVKRKT